MVRRFFLFLFPALLVCGDALDDAASQWVKRIQGHLAADEVAHVTWNEALPVDPGSLPYQTRAKALLSRGLQKRIRNPKTVEITATWSQNNKGSLLIAQIQRESGNVIEMVSLPQMAADAAPPLSARIEKRLIWEQEIRILDLVLIGENDLLVLDATGLTHYQRQEGKWQKKDATAVDMPPVRDARGRIAIAGDTLEAEVTGVACRGKWQPSLLLDCRPGGRFAAGRNTIEEPGWPPYYTRAEWNGDTLLAEPDGQTHVYDAARKATAAFARWGSDFVVTNACPASRMILASGPESGASEVLALYDLQKREPVRISGTLETPGPITALWPSASGALAVVRNRNPERYEAYSISLDCGR